MSSTDDRRFEVLRAIVADYVSTQEPVGSKALVERHNLGVSSATVRNDMAFLEAEGYIAQPHTSSGRVPTDKGYRAVRRPHRRRQAAVGRPSGERSSSSSNRASTWTTSCAAVCDCSRN